MTVRSQSAAGTPLAGGPSDLLARLQAFPRCASVSVADPLQVQRAIQSDVPMLVMLRGNAFDLPPLIELAHRHRKLVAVHLDLVAGLRPDPVAIRWLSHFGADAVITAHGQIVSAIKRERMTAILRLLLLRPDTVRAGLAAVKRAEPDFVEVLPGVILPSVRHLLAECDRPLFAGGFIQSARDVSSVFEAGAIAVTTSTEDLWTAS